MKEKGHGSSDEQAYRIAYLIAGFIRKTLTEAEHDELDAWVEESDDNMRLFEDLTDEDNIEANMVWMEKVRTEKALKETLAKVKAEERHRRQPVTRWWPYLAAASIIIAIVAFYVFRPAASPGTGTAGLSYSNQDVLPGGNRAQLHLSDGSIIDLAQAEKGLIKNEQGARIEKMKEGELMYANTNEAQGEVFNIVTTPKGGQYALTLSDGTKVWLNAQSSLRFPVHFGDTTRMVELDGEGYFEVAKDARHPFIVRLSNEEEVTVLGTHFNISGYTNEESKKVTLIEGSVQVKSSGGRLLLKPGEQALLKKSGLALQPSADLDEATGWKKGTFVFHDAGIYELMRQVERWYNVDIIYKAVIPDHFNATISRNEPVSKLLHLLELTGKIHFRIENKTIYVLP